MSNTNNKCLQLLTSAHDCHRRNQVAPAPPSLVTTLDLLFFSQDNKRNRDPQATNETKVACPHPIGTERGKANSRGRAQDIQGGACHYIDKALPTMGLEQTATVPGLLASLSS